jgi:hypothetical protein
MLARRTVRLLGGFALALMLGAVLAAPSQAATRWRKCSLRQGNIAAHAAGLRHALDSDRSLKRVFLGTRPSRVYRRPSTSLCGDYNGDGRTDRAVHYQCCTVSSPAPWVVLRHRASGWRIVFRRLHDTTFRLEPDGRSLLTTEPKYARSDALCCPSRLRIGKLRWTGRGFKRTFRIEHT